MLKSQPDVRGEAPQSQSKVRVSRQRARGAPVAELQQFLSDFKTGLGRLKALTQQLVARRGNERTASTQGIRVERSLRQDILHTLERELRLVERTAPPEIRDRIVREFRSKAEAAVSMGIPQAYAQLISAAEPFSASPTAAPAPAPAKALRPAQSPAVKALMSAVTAIRSGRLAFLPRETRMEARKLLRRIFSSGHAGRPASAPQVANTVQSQRLIPNIVQGMFRDYNQPERYESYIKAVEQAKSHDLPPAPARSGHTPTQSVASSRVMTSGSTSPPPTARLAPVPITAADMPRLAKAIPSFQTTGAAHAYMYEPDENVHVITRNDGLATTAESPPNRQGPESASSASPSRSRSPLAAPTAPSARSTNTVSGAGKAAPSGDSNQTVTAIGSLRIDGLPQFIANTEMRLSGLERQMRRQDG